jgi:hypothetical protein
MSSSTFHLLINFFCLVLSLQNNFHFLYEFLIVAQKSISVLYTINSFASFSKFPVLSKLLRDQIRKDLIFIFKVRVPVSTIFLSIYSFERTIAFWLPVQQKIEF